MMGIKHILLPGVVALCVAMAACATGRYTTRPQPFKVELLESDLNRGISTTGDVERLLGAPDGTGSMLLPGAARPETTWIYEKIEIESYPGKVLQDVLLVFFTGNVFDGFMWFSDTHPSWRKRE